MNSESVFESVRIVVSDIEMGEVLFVSDFSHLNDDLNVSEVLSRLVSEQRLEMISNGIYLKAEKNDLESLAASIDEIAHAIAKRSKVKIFPYGNTALNMLGLTTQTPLISEYNTTGSSRTIKIGNRKIVFLKSTPKNFEYKNDLFHLIVASMKHIGQRSIGDNEIKFIEKLLSDKNNTDYWEEDILLAPVWIRKILKSIIEK